MPITSQVELQEHLELAIRVELATIPPYLFAMYSIEDQGSEAALLLRSIVVEEMLHAALATNLLLAVGGSPRFAGTEYITPFPSELPHHRPPLRMELAPCSLETIEDLFMRIEKPEIHDAPAQPDQFETLGQFYHALELAMEGLSDGFDLFSNPQRGAQLSDSRFYRPVELDAEDSGGLMLIDDLASARAAIEVIVHQGEGLSDERWADPDHKELTHFHKLLQITEGVSPLGRVVPVRRNPSTADYPDDLRPVSDLFNALYRGVFLVLDRIFDADSNQSRAVGVLYLLMADVMSQLASFLVSRELGDGEFAGPTFEVFEFTNVSPLDEVTAMADRVAQLHPELSTVHDALKGLGFIL
ncbi:MAG: ferritin-like protein [Acidimicrobiia bacterium]